MAKASNQKLKILYLLQFLTENTDEDHPATLGQITGHLAGLGISAERKSIYDDLEALRAFGVEILTAGSGRSTAYYVAQREFELPELKLLVDSVQASRFITHRKTAELIRKIERLASVHQAQQLQRQVYVAGRIKAMNESIYYNVDAIHTAITHNRKIRFRYFNLTVDKQREYRRGGAYYAVSPYALTWDSENYYLIAYDDETAQIRHYRVDRMSAISETGEERSGAEAFRSLDMAVYARKVFGMFSGSELSVRMRFDRSMAGAVLDRLGTDCILIPDGDAHFTVTASVVPSPQFYAWVFGFGGMAQILGPESAVQGMERQLRETAALYPTAP